MCKQNPVLIEEMKKIKRYKQNADKATAATEHCASVNI